MNTLLKHKNQKINHPHKVNIIDEKEHDKQAIQSYKDEYSMLLLFFQLAYTHIDYR